MAAISNDRLLLGLLGSPIRHSASPAMHEAAAASVGLRGHYQLIEIAGADAAKLRTILDGVRLLGFAGINVTFPYKEAVLPLLDEVSDAARTIGAVNTVVVASDRLVGHNTDSSGFARAVTAAFGDRPAGPFALIGAGGVGKAIAFALADVSGSEIRVYDTDRGKAQALVAGLGPRAPARVCATVEEAAAGARGLINGTPIGMLPNRDSPVPFGLLRPDLWVADAVYAPLWTPLLEAARQIGARTMTGRELAIHQGLEAFRLFSGRIGSQEAVSASFDAVIAARDAVPPVAREAAAA